MGSQRLTLAKIAGEAKTTVVDLFQRWTSTQDDLAAVRSSIDRFGVALRLHGSKLPVIYYDEWIDHWSMADLFDYWLAPPGVSTPPSVAGDRFEMWCYPLPDEGRFAARIAAATVPQFQEEGWFVSRLREVVEAWTPLTNTAAIVLLREVNNGLTTDEEVSSSLTEVPCWMSEVAGSFHLR